CIKSWQQPSCNPDCHCKVDVPICLANLSMKLGRAIHFDSATEKIVGDDEAAWLSIPKYRAPWKFPVEYIS
ncbi:MAG: gfo/Idh/MocA family oxidoreductase, partial [Phycisphaerae bacterium]|nr:gfo/Idh/MocA family oxidoreductase [Phycisphaerae bacterium]NIW97946.1 gfo/Idh/MocA family oxidoreductase [Phycisphaerae bacterium]